MMKTWDDATSTSTKNAAIESLFLSSLPDDNFLDLDLKKTKGVKTYYPCISLTFYEAEDVLEEPKYSYDTDEIEDLFHDLADKWHKETGTSSSTMMMFLHPAYQRIIGLGLQAIPFLLQELRDRPDHWFWALRCIAGDDQDPTTSEDTFDEAVSSWLMWGIEKGYIFSEKS